MQPIIIGAGRGLRLKTLTDHQPKCFARIRQRRILDWLLKALDEAGLVTPVFVGGYQIELIRSDYPQLTFCHNENWRQNNILASLFCAEQYMNTGFVCTYADILYHSRVLCRVLAHPADIVLCVDTDWRTRYAGRSQHPENDAEKVVACGDQIVCIGRDIQPETASGEYIGVAKFSAKGAALLRHHHWRARNLFRRRIWREETVFEKAYLIHLYAEMLEHGVDFHMVTTNGEYMEIDTEEDFTLANQLWPYQPCGY